MKNSESPIQIKKPKLIVVEGDDDKMFFEAFINHLGYEDIQVVSIEGISNLRPKLKSITLSSPFARGEVTHLGIVRDANDNPSGAFQSVCDALRVLNLGAPEKPMRLVGGRPKISIMILPEDGVPGMLEDLILKYVEEDPAMFCVEEYFKCLKQRNIQFEPKESKVRIHVFLASKDELKKSLGIAAQAGYFPFDNTAFEKTKDFLRQIGT